MESDEMIVFDPLGELQKVVDDIKNLEQEEQHDLRT